MANVPNLRFRGFEGEWEIKKLGEICKFVRGPFGSALKKDFFVNEGYAVYEQFHAINNNFNSFRYYITEEKFNELKRFSVHSKDLIMSCSGTMGKFAIVPKESKKGVINQALLKLTTKENYNYKFIKSVLELPDTQNELLSQSAGGAIKNIVGIPQIKEIDLHIPILKEQQKIALFVSLIDQRIETQIQIIKELKSLKKALRSKLYQQIIKNEATEQIANLLNYEQPTNYIVTNADYSDDYSLIPVLTANKAFILGYTDEDFGIYNKGECIIFDDFTMDLKYVDFPFKVKSSAIKILTAKQGVNLRFIYEYLSFLKLTSTDHKRHYISEIEPMCISLPKIEIQNNTANILSILDEKLETEKQILKKYTEQKKYLLANLFI